MKCFYHEDKESVYVCEECKKALCETCIEEKKARVLCDDCIDDIRKKALRPSENVNVKYNSFLGLIFSLFPGAGQMYLGVMNRGLQLMFLFLTGLFFATEFIYVTGVLVPIVILVWFYSFFDYLFIKRKIDNGDVVFDENLYSIKTKRIEIKYIGIGLVIFGIWLVCGAFLDFSHISYEVRNFVRDMVVPIFMIGAGTFILLKTKKKVTEDKIIVNDKEEVKE